MRDAGYFVIPSNPFRTKTMAHSRIKTDKIDGGVLAGILADLLRMNLIPACYTPPDEIGGCARWCGTASTWPRSTPP